MTYTYQQHIDDAWTGAASGGTWDVINPATEDVVRTVPFGGWKQSGLGHESGSEGLSEYLETKLVAVGGLGG